MDAPTTGVGFLGTPIVSETSKNGLKKKTTTAEKGPFAEKRYRFKVKMGKRANRKFDRNTIMGPLGVGVPLDGKSLSSREAGGNPLDSTGYEPV